MLSYAAPWCYGGSHYLADANYCPNLLGAGLASTAPVTKWAVDKTQLPSVPSAPVTGSNWPVAGRNVGIITSTKQGIANNTNDGVGLNFTANSAIVSVVVRGSGGSGVVTNTACSMRYQYGSASGGLNNGGTAYANGSAVMLTTSNVFGGGGPDTDQCSLSAMALPAGFNAGQWYFIGNSSVASGAQTFNLYASQADALAGNSNFVTPTTTVCGIQCYGIPWNTPIADGSTGTYNGENSNGGQARVAEGFGGLAIAKIYAFSAPGQTTPYPELDSAVGGTNVLTNGVTAAKTIAQDVGVTFSDFPTYAVAA